MARQHTGASTGSLVLVVHASAGHGRLAERLLESAGYEVVTASEPDDVATLARYGQPDLVVVDGRDARTVADALAAKVVVPILIVASDGGARPSDGGDHPSRCSLGTLLHEASRCLSAPDGDPTGRTGSRD